MTESIICLAICVILFRNFQIEGYMVTTGSMAPNLLGFHKRITCPNCGEHFAFGVAFDQSTHSTSANADSLDEEIVSLSDSESEGGEDSPIEPAFSKGRSPYVYCPNCGQDSIDISKVPKNHGDHLLVHKNAYQFRDPKRWEVIVFRNPQKPTEAYVKRAIGLPGENVRIYQGDVVINGKLVRKDLETQKALRIQVNDFEHQPKNDQDPTPRWIPDQEESPWTQTEHGFLFLPEEQKNNNPEVNNEDPNWLVYHHRIRSGGNHRTTIQLPASLRNWGDYDDQQNQLIYNSLNKELSCIGVMSPENYQKLLSIYSTEELEQAISELYEKSHSSPITDFYGYNRMITKMDSNPVRDIMLCLDVKYRDHEGSITFEISDGTEQYQFTLDLKEKRATLVSRTENLIIDSVTLEENSISSNFHLDFSLFDRQIIVTIDGKEMFAPVPLPVTEFDSSQLTSKPIRISATGTLWDISEIKVFRDVYYTGKGYVKGFQLKEDEYYVLGDNSPISFDSRRWENAAVHKRYFLGKPFIVHLPSKPGRLKIGNKETYIRMPDFKRIRYIR